MRSTEPQRNEAIYAYIRGFNAADKNRISTAALFRQQRAEDEIEAGELYRMADGYDTIPLTLYRSIHDAEHVLRLNTPADEIRWRPGQRRSGGFGGGSGAHHRTARLLQQQPGTPGSIQFVADPKRKRGSIEALAMGQVNRVVLRFRERFREPCEGLAHLSFLHGAGEDVPTLWTQSPVCAPVVTAWVGGPKAMHRTEGKDLVASAFANSGACQQHRDELSGKLLATWYLHDRQSDPYARGAFSYVPAGELDAAETLGEPVESTLFFAGEATDTTAHWGTVHAAIRTGERAASQILDTFRR